MHHPWAGPAWPSSCSPGAEVWKGEKKGPWKPRAQRERVAWDCRPGGSATPCLQPLSLSSGPSPAWTSLRHLQHHGSLTQVQTQLLGLIPVMSSLALVPGDAPLSPLSALYPILPLLSTSSVTTLAHTPALATPWSGCRPLGRPYSHCSAHQELAGPF